MALSRLPRPRLTGFGCGVLATVVMAAAGWLSGQLGGAPVLYGVLFLLACAAAAVWVRPADLICAPIAAPIAFAVGLLPSAKALTVVTELAMGAPWLFAGTFLATVIVLVRGALQLLRRRRRAGRAARR
ncbi:hypothetical protein PJ985_04975 [Streptomyces sp. ACA25]|uniref:DUF6542 domain-containing protein n=1 Tax=Streptomyces sp. ACA25 TaxID=3022596 RepID=UPI0023082A63|nr:DUF6542 domain-containing protein [Streptomyces sp. ACA25]MDB1086916.1 hypothetical protein [Streptomyces sp. ACA25]